MKHFLKVEAFSASEFSSILSLAKTIKHEHKAGKKHTHLSGKNIGLIFEKPSNRTRVSFEVGVNHLGGQTVYIQKQDIGMGSREPIEDVARVLSRMVDAVVIRSIYQETIDTFAKWATVPIINGLSDKHHPCQAVADVMTIIEHKPSASVKVCYIGDGNNVCVSLIQLCELLGITIVVSCPKGYEPPIPATVIYDPNEAVKGADIIYTDVWVSMGQEAEEKERLAIFKPYCVTMELVKQAKHDVSFMHCLPANRGQEVSADVFESAHSIVFDQAENRLHAQKAILISLLSQGVL
jgi:ornithine carbamoyltransferase